RTQTGAVDWRKMAAADVVSLVAMTKQTSVAAYANAAGRRSRRSPRRASGTRRASASAATPERKLATWKAVSVVILIAAPPVEKRSAAARTDRWAPRGEADMSAPPHGRDLFGGKRGTALDLQRRRGLVRPHHLPSLAARTGIVPAGARAALVAAA